MKYPKDISTSILYSKDELEKRAAELGKQISEDYQDKNLTVVCILKGAFFFFSDVVANIDCDLDVEFIKASSYIGTNTSGVVEIKKIGEFEIKGRDILIVEDIVDTGITMSNLISYFQGMGCASVCVCTLLNKAERRKVNVDVKYIGFEIENQFVIGYGLDYNQKYRNLPYIGIMNPKYI